MTSEMDRLFRSLPEEDCRAFLALGEQVAFEAAEVILPAGRSEWDVHVVQQGEVSVWIGNVRLADLKVGQAIGASVIVLPQIRRSAVRGNRKGTLLRIPRDAILEFFKARPDWMFRQFCVDLLAIEVEALNQRNARIAEIENQLLNVSKPDRRDGYKLLIVEDEVDVRNAMAELFKEKYQVVTAADGREGVEKTFSERPDLILLDLRLPELDGFQVCERVKGHSATRHIPIVMVTALTTTPDKVKGIKYGADEYMNKPVDIHHLRDTVSRILEKAYG